MRTLVARIAGTDVYDDQLELVQDALNYEPTTPAEIAEAQIAQRLSSMINDLDEFTAMAVNPETVDLIEKESIAFSQVLCRAELIASFLNARKPQDMRINRRR
jgi:hypothetical protein